MTRKRVRNQDIMRLSNNRGFELNRKKARGRGTEGILACRNLEEVRGILKIVGMKNRVDVLTLRFCGEKKEPKDVELIPRLRNNGKGAATEYLGKSDEPENKADEPTSKDRKKKNREKGSRGRLTARKGGNQENNDSCQCLSSPRESSKTMKTLLLSYIKRVGWICQQ